MTDFNRETNHRRAAEVARQVAIANALTPAEVISIDSAARVTARQVAATAGKPQPDSNALSRIGAEAVRAAQIAKVGA